MDVTILQEDAATSVVRERYMRLAGQEVSTKNCERVNLADTFADKWGARVDETVRAVLERDQQMMEQQKRDQGARLKMAPMLTQKYATPWWYQTYLLTIRNIKTAWRDPRLIVSQMISTLLLSGILATFFLNINNPGAAIQNRAGLLVWMIMNEAFTTEYVMVHCLFIITQSLTTHTKK